VCWLPQSAKAIGSEASNTVSVINLYETKLPGWQNQTRLLSAEYDDDDHNTDKDTWYIPTICLAFV